MNWNFYVNNSYVQFFSKIVFLWYLGIKILRILDIKFVEILTSYFYKLIAFGCCCAPFILFVTKIPTISFLWDVMCLVINEMNDMPCLLTNNKLHFTK